jgi:hypothetical protein
MPSRIYALQTGAFLTWQWPRGRVPSLQGLGLEPGRVRRVGMTANYLPYSGIRRGRDELVPYSIERV